MQQIAMAVVVAREGGTLEVPIHEFEQIVERYGGKGNVSMITEQIDEGGSKRIRATLVNKKPGQGELMA